jgi:aldehyde:ferredoxin oxidoreductase
MGSKNLKAVAVRGNGSKGVQDRGKLKEIAQWLIGEGKKLWEPMHLHGTNRNLRNLSDAGGLPTRNFNLGHFESADDITGVTVSESILVDRTTCYSCVVRCKRAVEIKQGPYRVDPAYGGPEYETAAALGSNCGVSDLDAVAAGNQLCNAAGLDTISGGMMVSFAMECFENGIITEQDTGGLSLRFGNAEAMVKLLGMIVEREGIGEILGRGYRACIEAWGPKAEPFAIHVKGQPLAMHEPRLKFGLGLGYAISPTGADHVHNLHDTLFATEDNLFKLRPYGILKPVLPQEFGGEKIRLFYYVALNELLKNMLGLCLFLPYDPNRIVDIVRGITGWDTSLAEMFKGAERGMALARAFNAREGFTAADDTLPERFFQSFEEGPLKGVFPDREGFQSALEDLYSVLGWDPVSGAPTRGKYGELGLDWVAEQMERDGNL